jgi:hypothetical protein
MGLAIESRFIRILSTTNTLSVGYLAYPVSCLTYLTVRTLTDDLRKKQKSNFYTYCSVIMHKYRGVDTLFASKPQKSLKPFCPLHRGAVSLIAD